MSIYPKAKVELLPESATQARMTPTAIIDHSNAAESDDLYGWWNSPGQDLECHFQVSWEGVVYQYMDTNVCADANVAANGFAVSIEVANSPTLQGFLNNKDTAGMQRQFDLDVYSPAQRVALIDLHAWLHDEHFTIPRKVCSDGVNGVGWHEKFNSWTTPGHHCPGNERVNLLLNDIYPASFAGSTTDSGDDFDMAMSKQELSDLIDQRVRKVTIDILRAPEFFGTVSKPGVVRTILVKSTTAAEQAQAAALYALAVSNKLDAPAAKK